MMRRASSGVLILLFFFSIPLFAEVKRIVIIKLDGVPENVLERELSRVDPITHKSTLPWMDRVFAQGGTRIDNFYVRGISLSTPSWSMLDTGQHLQIHGNAEFDRYTGRVYDYMNFFPFYVGYARLRKVDMPGVEVLDDQKIPLLIDRFQYPAIYQSFQLYQRGVRWETLKNALPNHFARSVRELLDEWTIGFGLGSTVEEQTERELIAALDNSSIQYLDYFTGDFDHVAHAASDLASQRLALQRIDALIGRVWTAIQASPIAAQTVLAAVSDHGMNTQPGLYSQGYSLLHFFNSRAGGGHHVITNRHPLDEYKLSGLDPFVSEVVTHSDESLYLKGEGDNYPTALLDLDGNERAAVYLRNSAFNTLHILLKEINSSAIEPGLRRASISAFFHVVDRHRAEWQVTLQQISEELGAVRRAMEQQRVRVELQPKKWTEEQRDLGLDKAARRLAVQLDSWREEERTYSAYARALSKLLTLEPNDFDHHRLTAEELFPRRAMGDPNSVYDLENYVAGPAAGGLVLASDGSLDFAHSFEHINYAPVLASLAVRNNVQAGVGSHPIDFLAMTVPKAAFTFPAGDTPTEDPIWLYASEDKQALILSRGNELRYMPVRGLRQDAEGAVHFEPCAFAPGLPLRMFEDANLAVPPADREAWLNSWHSESDWFHAIYQAAYSNGIIALHEQFLPPILAQSEDLDGALLARFNQRRRRLAEPDFLIFANDHWNFNVRNFNPGGNHGSFLRASTHAILLFAGGADTGIPRDQQVQAPYDSLSFVPTILDLMGMQSEAAKLPGRPIPEVVTTEPQPKGAGHSH
jgi:Type I phosphodiesterase / nucleotide pyrophosphatase